MSRLIVTLQKHRAEMEASLEEPLSRVRELQEDIKNLKMHMKPLQDEIDEINAVIDALKENAEKRDAARMFEGAVEQVAADFRQKGNE